MQDKGARLSEIVKVIESAMNLIDQYVLSRPVQKVFDHLEDAILWSQVLVNTIPMKSEIKDKQQEEIIHKEEVIDKKD